MFLGYSSSIGEVIKNIRRQYAFFRWPDIDHMKKYGKNIFQFENEICNCHAECVYFHHIVPTMKKSKVGRCVSVKCIFLGGGGGGGQNTK